MSMPIMVLPHVHPSSSCSVLYSFPWAKELPVIQSAFITSRYVFVCVDSSFILRSFRIFQQTSLHLKSHYFYHNL